jgi:hypothetical protein
MAVLDAALEFSDAQALASVSSGASVKSTNVVDTRKNLYTDAWGTAINAEIGGSVLNVNVNTILVGAGAVIRADLVSKADVSISSGATVIASVTVPAVSVAGTRFSLKLPPGTEALRYMGILYTAVGAKLTSAKFDAYMSLDSEKYD